MIRKKDGLLNKAHCCSKVGTYFRKLGLSIYMSLLLADEISIHSATCTMGCINYSLDGGDQKQEVLTEIHECDNVASERYFPLYVTYHTYSCFPSNMG